MSSQAKAALSMITARRIEEMRIRLKLTQQAVAEGSRMARSSYVEKALGSRQKFSVDQCEDVAGYFRRVTGRDLTGWPFVDEKTADALDSLLALSKK
jgi:transcriptional regulator with XRE-family HTH domain